MSYYVYILTNKACSVLYTGMTSDLIQRVWAHKDRLIEGFTKRYGVNRLVYYEQCDDAATALWREKQIKAGSRAKKMALIDGFNPKWRDLYQEIAGGGP